MTCQICGRQSAPGTKLCADCRAARKRAYDATITQPLLAMAGARSVSRTLSRLRRSDSSPEAKARRAARKAKAAADPVAPPAAIEPSARSRTLLWVWLAIGIVLAAIAGWYLPSHTLAAPDGDATPLASAPASQQGALDAGVDPARVKPPEPAPVASALPPLPAIVERELVPHSSAAGKPAVPKRVNAAPKAVVTAPEAPPEVEIVRVPPLALTPAAPQVPRADPWQQMNQAIGSCPEGFLARVVCEQRVRLRYCEGQWGQVPQCPGGPNADHD